MTGILEGRRAFGNVMKYLLMGTSSNFGNMFSMAGASLFLPFLPMLPTQILLNNFLYDMAQVTIPTDNVDAAYVRAPQRWDIRLIRNFMLFIGPISSIYDFLTFYVLLVLLHAKEAEFHTGWFVESLATQTLVLFVIRTQRESFPQPAQPSAHGYHAGNCRSGNCFSIPAIRDQTGIYTASAYLFRFPRGRNSHISILVEVAKRFLMHKTLRQSPV